MSSPLQFSENHNLVRADQSYWQRKLTDVDKGPGLAKLVLFGKKKQPKLIQKLSMTEKAFGGNYKIIFTIAGSSFLVSFKIELFATVVEGLQM